MNPYQISNDDQSKYVHLKVTELARAMEFYVDLLGFKVTSPTKTIPRPTSQPEVIIICWLWILGLLSIYPNLKLRVRVFFIPSSNIQPKKI